jgi:Flp pilus assembly protein CpaB
MKGRGLVVFLALILATLATAGVFMYTRGAKEPGTGTEVQVVVSKVDVAARTDLDQLIKDDQFRISQVPESVVVDGAVTSVDQLAGKSNSEAILAGEQIPVARISGDVPGGAVGIPEGMQALNVSLDASRAVAGVLAAGDHVSLYGTYSDFKDIKTGEALPTMTTVLVPTVEVLAVYRPVSTSVVGGDEEGQAQQAGIGAVSVTFALTPEDAQKFVFTLEAGRVWMGLLPPDETGESLPEITFAEVIG